MLNAALPGSLLDECAPITDQSMAKLREELVLGRLTGRGLHRVRRVARTIADLDDPERPLVEVEHIVLALQLRVQLRRRAALGAA